MKDKRKNIIITVITLLILFVSICFTMTQLKRKKSGEVTKGKNENMNELQNNIDNNKENNNDDDSEVELNITEESSEVISEEAEVNVEPESVDDSWKQVYIDEINSFRDEYENAYGALRDINGDGIPELFLEVDHNQPDGESHSYTCLDGKLKRFSETIELQRWDYGFYVSSKAIICCDLGKPLEGNIAIYEMNEDDLVEVEKYEIKNLGGNDTSVVPSYYNLNGSSISEKEFIGEMSSLYKFEVTVERSEMENGDSSWISYSYEIDSDFNPNLKTLLGYELLIKGIDNYESVNSDTNMAEKVCDSGEELFRYNFSEELAEDWQVAFYKKIPKLRPEAIYRSTASEDSAYSFFLNDIDKDDIPELFIRYGNCEANFHCTVYKYNIGELKELGTFECFNSYFYSISDNGFLRYQMYQGYYSVYKAVLDDDELAYESLANQVQGDYPDITDFDSSAEIINEHSFKSYLPIVAYNKDISTKSDEDNDEVKRIIEDTYLSDGYLYTIIAEDYRGEKEIGYKRLSDITQIGFINENDSVDLCDNPIWGDMNGDGQDECLLTFYASSENRYDEVLLSYQSGIIYAYVLGMSSGNCVIENGMMQEYYDDYNNYIKVKFYKDEVYVCSELKDK